MDNIDSSSQPYPRIACGSTFKDYFIRGGCAPLALGLLLGTSTGVIKVPRFGEVDIGSLHQRLSSSKVLNENDTEKLFELIREIESSSKLEDYYNTPFNYSSESMTCKDLLEIKSRFLKERNDTVLEILKNLKKHGKAIHKITSNGKVTSTYFYRYDSVSGVFKKIDMQYDSLRANNKELIDDALAKRASSDPDFKISQEKIQVIKKMIKRLFCQKFGMKTEDILSVELLKSNNSAETFNAYLEYKDPISPAFRRSSVFTVDADSGRSSISNYKPGVFSPEEDTVDDSIGNQLALVSNNSVLDAFLKNKKLGIMALSTDSSGDVFIVTHKKGKWNPHSLIKIPAKNQNEIQETHVLTKRNNYIDFYDLSADKLGKIKISFCAYEQFQREMGFQINPKARKKFLKGLMKKP